MICSITHLLLFHQYVNELLVSNSHALFRNGSFLTFHITSNNVVIISTESLVVSTKYNAHYLFLTFQPINYLVR